MAVAQHATGRAAGLRRVRVSVRVRSPRLGLRSLRLPPPLPLRPPPLLRSRSAYSYISLYLPISPQVEINLQLGEYSASAHKKMQLLPAEIVRDFDDFRTVVTLTLTQAQTLILTLTPTLALTLTLTLTLTLAPTRSSAPTRWPLPSRAPRPALITPNPGPNPLTLTSTLTPDLTPTPALAPGLAVDSSPEP